MTALRRSTHQPLVGLAIICAYVGAANLGGSLADVAGIVTAVWPPSGIALAALAIFGIRMWPALLAGVVVAEMTLGLPPGTAALIGVGNTLAAVAGLWLMRRLAGFRPTMERVSDVVALSLLGGLACTIAASVGALALWQHGLIEQHALGLTWLVWWAGDVGGVLVVAPALMALATMPWRRGLDRRRALEMGLLALVVAALAPLVLVVPTAYPFLVTAPLVWAALRFGTRGAALCSLALAGVVVVASAMGAGPFVHGPLLDRVLLTAAFAGITGTTSLVIGAIQTERAQAATRLRHATRAAERERGFLAAVLESLDTGVVACDAGGTLALFNRATRDLHGAPEEPLPASEWAARYALLRPDGSPMRGEDVPLYRALRGEPVEHVEMMIEGPGGEHRTLLANGRQIRDGEGEVLGAVVAMHDVTDRNAAQEALRRSEARMRALVDLVPIGIFSTDARGRCELVNPRWEEMAGMAGADALGSGWAKALHPGDRARVLDAWATAAATGAELHHEYRYRRADGQVAWIESRAVPVRDEAGEVRGWVGANTDIGERLLQGRELAARERIARAVADEREPHQVFALVAEEAARVMALDTAGIVRFEGDAGVIVGAWAREGLAAAPVGASLPLDGGSASAEVFRTGRPATAEHSPADPSMHRLFHQRTPRLSAVAAPVRVGGTLWGAVGVAADDGSLPAGAVARLERFADLVGLAVASSDARAQLATLAATDHLTGLPNRRAFCDRMASEVERAGRHDRELSLVVLDLDHFKAINDTHGHPVGDRVLIEAARRLFASVREGETVARIGGEEFAWILPETDGDGAAGAAERLRAAIAAEPFAGVGTLTVSMGVADMSDASDADDLFRVADLALYRAKSDGRDRVCRYSSPAAALTPAGG